MSKKFRLLMTLVLVIGLFGGLLTGSTVSADPTPGQVVELPRIDLGDVFGTGDWDTKIQVQNVGPVSGGAVVFFWPAYDGTCPSNDPGPMGHACMQLPWNGVWTLHNQIPAGAYSAIVYSVSAPLFQAACAAASTSTTEGWKAWMLTYAYTGPNLAVTVDRWGPDAYGDGFEISSSYTGVSDPVMVGPTFQYFAPYIMHGYNNLDTTLTIQNSGQHGTSIWIYYKEEGNCEFMKAQHVECIAPGQAIRIGPGADKNMAYPTPEIDAPWLGSVYITANEPLGIIVDQLSHPPSANRATLLSARGRPWFQDWPETKYYADLLYREISGWSSSIQVQNLTVTSQPTFVTVDFMDQSGDEILFVGDWVCRNGAKTFYLPAITDLGVNFPFGYVGAAEVESHAQVDYPGQTHAGQPIFAVVDLKKDKVYDNGTGFWRHTVAGETQAGAYNAHPEYEKTNAWIWAMPFIAKEQEGVTSRIAIRNNSNCNKISGNIYIKDETGTVVTRIPVPWLHPKHMKIFDLAYFGTIARGFVGAAVFVVEGFADELPDTGGVEQLCDTNGDGITDQLPVMPSVVVLNYGFAAELPIGSGAGPLTDLGDLTRVYEGIPFGYYEQTCYGDIKGNLFSDLGSVSDDPSSEPFPLYPADVYRLDRIDDGPFTADGTAYVGVDCGESGPIRLAGAHVELQMLYDGDPYVPGRTVGMWYKEAETTTSSAGWYQFKNKLALGETYRLKIFVEEPGNTVSYVLDQFVATCDVTTNFVIQKNIWDDELALNTGEWCDAAVSEACFEAVDMADTDSTGWYRIINQTEGSHIWKAHKSGFADCTETVAIPCNDQVYWNPELRCADIDLTVNVTQEDGAYPVQGAKVTVTWDLDDELCIDDPDRDDLTDVTGDADFTDALQTKLGEGVSIKVEKDGYDTKTVTLAATGADFLHVDDFYQCPSTSVRTTEIELCAYFTVRGDSGYGAGYRVTAEGKATGAMVTPDQPGGDLTDVNGMYALEVSKAAVDAEGDAFFIRIYTPSGVLVYESVEQAMANFDCGSVNTHIMP